MLLNELTPVRYWRNKKLSESLVFFSLWDWSRLCGERGKKSSLNPLIFFHSIRTKGLGITEGLPKPFHKEPPLVSPPHNFLSSIPNPPVFINTWKKLSTKDSLQYISFLNWGDGKSDAERKSFFFLKRPSHWLDTRCPVLERYLSV